MSAINYEMRYDANNYLSRSFSQVGVHVEEHLDGRTITTDVTDRWAKISEIFNEREVFNNLPWNEDIKISSLAVYMLYRIDDSKFDRLIKMIKDKDVKRISRYVDTNQIPLMCELRGEDSSNKGVGSGENSASEQTPSPDKSEDKIASSSEGSAKSKRRKKKKSESSESEGCPSVESFIFSEKKGEPVEEKPYMRQQRGAWFTVSISRFCLSDEAKRNLSGERDANHFVDLNHINEAVGKILLKKISDGAEYAPLYQLGPNKFLKMVVRKYSGTPLMLTTCYYMTRSELERKNEYKFMSSSGLDAVIEKFPKLTGNARSEYVRVSK